MDYKDSDELIKLKSSAMINTVLASVCKLNYEFVYGILERSGFTKKQIEVFMKVDWNNLTKKEMQ